LREEYNPLRYTIWLPFLRTADMWLRPRTEILHIDTRWWDFDEHRKESTFAVLWAGLNLLFLLAAFRGWMQWKLGLAGVFVVSFVLLRSMFLSSLENPEPRYMLECFPVLLALAGGAFARSMASARSSFKPTV
jgi:hypothetical protein